MEIVVIRWKDVYKQMNDESFNDEKNLESYSTPISTIGWLYRKTEKSILLVQEFSEGKPRDYFIIPRSFILSITTISGYEEI
jgi:hypothetical protein